MHDKPRRHTYTRDVALTRWVYERDRTEQDQRDQAIGVLIDMGDTTYEDPEDYIVLTDRRKSLWLIGRPPKKLCPIEWRP